ncbi:hypothetical protein FDECE_7042 [Fusarium decemcellulare]|nr:hypothetical protein FDECE_7042 [Fusarium decemcellulare]
MENNNQPEYPQGVGHTIDGLSEGHLALTGSSEPPVHQAVAEAGDQPNVSMSFSSPEEEKEIMPVSTENETNASMEEVKNRPSSFPGKGKTDCFAKMSAEDLLSALDYLEGKSCYFCIKPQPGEDGAPVAEEPQADDPMPTLNNGEFTTVTFPPDENPSTFWPAPALTAEQHEVAQSLTPEDLTLTPQREQALNLSAEMGGFRQQMAHRRNLIWLYERQRRARLQRSDNANLQRTQLSGDLGEDGNDNADDAGNDGRVGDGNNEVPLDPTIARPYAGWVDNLYVNDPPGYIRHAQSLGLPLAMRPMRPLTEDDLKYTPNKPVNATQNNAGPGDTATQNIAETPPVHSNAAPTENTLVRDVGTQTIQQGPNWPNSVWRNPVHASWAAAGVAVGYFPTAKVPGAMHTTNQNTA